MSKLLSLSLLSLLALLVSAGNDWSQPCLQGVCSYDIPASETSMEGKMILTGASHEISDVTSAAGWEILNCSSTALAQDIRLVCTGDEASCSHIFQNGAKHTIIRLPENCGKSPFAHVSNAWVSEDQSIPPHLSSRVARRVGTTPTVHALSIDINITSSNNNISFVVTGANIPGAMKNVTITPPSSRRLSREVDERGLDDLVSDTFGTLSAFSLPDPFKPINANETTGPIPIDIDKQFNVFNTSISCSATEKAKISVDVNAKAHGSVSLGFIVAGELSIPPKITDLGVFAAMTTELDGTLNIDSNIVGKVDTGRIPLFTLGLPGLSVPGILALGPSFSVNAEAKAIIDDMDVDMAVDLAYSIDNLQLFFPPSDDHPSTANASPKDTPLKLSVSPGSTANTSFEAHLIPSIDFGLTFAEVATASIFLDLDTFASLGLSLADGVTGNGNNTGAQSASTEVDRCVDVKGGLSVNAGARGSFLKLFGVSTHISLFSKTFDFFQKCYSDFTYTTATSSIVPNSTAANAIGSGALSNSTMTSPQSSVPSGSGVLPTTGSSTSASFLSDSSHSVVSSATPSSLSASANPAVSRRSPRSHKPFVRAGALEKRDFSCLTVAVKAASSIVDQILSSSTFKDL